MLYPVDSHLNYAIKKAAATGGDGRAFTRRSPLTLETMLRLFVGAEGGSLDKVLHAAGIKATASAVSQRRAQIATDTFRTAFNNFNDLCTDDRQLLGYKIIATDGTTVTIPRNPGSPSWVCNPGIPNGVNQLHVTPFYDVLARTFVDVEIQPEPAKNEIAAALTMLQRNSFEQKTLILADRGFESYNFLAHMLEAPNVDFIVRLKQQRSAMKAVAKIPMMTVDCDVSFTICTTQKNSDKANPNYVFLQVPKKTKPGAKTRCAKWDFDNYYPMRFRICRFPIGDGSDGGEVFETVATSLPRSFDLEAIKQMYHFRWGVESSFRDLKYTLGLTNFHGKSELFAEQEIFSNLLAFNYAARVCNEVVVKQPKDGAYAYKVNFKMAVALCREFIRTRSADGEALRAQIADYTVPIRPGRRDERDLKVKGFPGFVYRVAA